MTLPRAQLGRFDDEYGGRGGRLDLGLLVRRCLRVDSRALRLAPGPGSCLSVGSAAFRPRKIKDLESVVREIVRHCLSSVRADEPIDFISTVANQIPLLTMCTVMGVNPAKATDFFKWDRELRTIFEPHGQCPDLRDMSEMFDFFEAVIAERRHSPMSDLISMLL